MAKKKETELLLAEMDAELECECMTFSEVSEIERCETHIPGLTTLLGGGWPRGRIVEFYTRENVGKTTAAIQSCAGIQTAFLKAKEEGKALLSLDNPDSVGRAAFIDVEKKLDPYWAATQFKLQFPKKIRIKKKLVPEDNGFRPYRPKSAEHAANVIERFVRSGLYDAIFIDSVAAMCPAKELEDDVGKQHRQLQARIMTQHCRKVIDPLCESPTSLIYLNQARVVGTYPNGAPIIEGPGASAFKHQAAIRLYGTRPKQIKRGEKVIGHEVKVKVVKSQVWGCLLNNFCMLPLYYGEGYCPFTEILNFAIAFEVISQDKKTYFYKDKKIATSFRALREWAAEYPATFEKIKAEVQGAEETEDSEFTNTQEDDDLNF